MRRLVSRVIFVATVVTVLSVGGGNAWPQAAWYEGFETAEPSWEGDRSDARFQVLLHQRVQGEARTGRRCERLTISASGGTYVYFRHEVGRPRVIDELSPSVQVKSDRSGLQLLARVVLPRTVDPRTGQPVSALVGGSSYTGVGHWQQLRIDQIPRLVARQTVVLRSQLGPHVDPREAYLDCVLLNVHGGPGVTNVWIDDLDIAGFVASGRQAPSTVRRGSPRDEPIALASSPQRAPSAAQEPRVPSAAGGSRIELVGSTLLAEGRPVFPRIIQYQGEPLSFLKELGFNAVWLPRLPPAEVLVEADRQGLWLICPPPPLVEPTTSEGPPEPRVPIGPQYDRVLAWDLGRGLSTDRLNATRQWAEQLRTADSGNDRPLICGPRSELRAYSRYVDLLMIGRSPLGTSLELTDYGNWLRQRPRLARPGTPIWSSVQTQPPPALVEQWAALGHDEQFPTACPSEQIRLLAYTAITAGARGLLFESRSALDEGDPDSHRRALTLRLLNLELELIEPWLAAGKVVATLRGSEPEVLGALFRKDRSRLLVPIRSARGAQFVAARSAGRGVSFRVPGIPESNNVYQLVPGGLRPLRHKRVTGGTLVTLDEFGLTSLALLTQEPLVVSSLTRRAMEVGRRAAELQRRLAGAKLEMVQQVAGRLSRGRPPAPHVTEWLSAARKGLQRCDGLLAAHDYAAAYLEAGRAMRSLRLVERSAWEGAVGTLPSPVSSPGAVSFRTLPGHRELMEWVASSPPAANQLAGGDFEDIGLMFQAGWSHVQHPTPAVFAQADLAPVAARSGRFGLRLAARSAEPENAPALVESPPTSITSPGVFVEAGQLVAIHGWVQVPSAITGSVDGLVITDSLGGEPLAERIGQTTGWREFTLWRIAPRSGEVTVRFTLTGLGEAWLDDVTIQRLPPPRLRTAAARHPSQAPTRLPPTYLSGWR